MTLAARLRLAGATCSKIIQSGNRRITLFGNRVSKGKQSCHIERSSRWLRPFSSVSRAWPWFQVMPSPIAVGAPALAALALAALAFITEARIEQVFIVAQPYVVAWR
jgi:hypothetical protein